jgi:hypothetical protein
MLYALDSRGLTARAAGCTIAGPFARILGPDEALSPDGLLHTYSELIKDGFGHHP